MATADEIRERLDKADREVLKARHELKELGAVCLAGECSAVSTILCEMMRPGTIEQFTLRKE